MEKIGCADIIHAILMDRIVHFVSVLFIYAMMVQWGNRSLKKIQMKKFGIAPRADRFTRKRSL